VVVILAVLLLSASGVFVYTQYRLSEIKTTSCKSCTARTTTAAPFNILLVGSDSRQFVDDSQEAEQYGSAADVGGQRSDVTIVARIVPATHQVLILSIPRDLWVTIPGDVSGVSGPNRINSAFNNGPDLLVQTIQDDLGVPINGVAEANFAGFSSMVNALGGIWLDFPDPVYDDYSGLKIKTTGCQLINGTQALALVRSRHLYYSPDDGDYYDYDGDSDFSRIQRQDAFFRGLIARADSEITNPIALNNFLGAVVSDLTVDPGLKAQLPTLAEEFHGVSTSALTTETLPTTEFQNAAGDVLQEAQPYGSQMIAQFLAFGTKSTPSTSTTTTIPTLSPSAVTVQVLNGAGTAGLATTASSALAQDGFTILGTGNAANFSFTASEIQYAPGDKTAAELLADSLEGSTTLVEDNALTHHTVILSLGSDFTGVVSPGESGSTSGATSSASAPPTTTTIPSNVVTNTQTEPWNPTPCNE
jgi:LCP family protein required for cell wall assembly